MAEISEKSFPFDTEELDGNYDREYPADDFARYFRAFITSGIFMREPTNLQVVANGDMTVTLKPGSMIIDGYRYDNTNDIVIPISAADGMQNRIDRISIMWSKEDRDIHYVVREGTKSYNPVVPGLRRNEEYKDYIVADIYIKAGVIGITQANITDQRLNTAVCGLATPFTEIDLSTLAVQIQDFYKQTMKEVGEWRDDEEEALRTWVTTLKEEKTAQLQKLITDMENMKDDSAIEFSDWFTGNTNNWMEEFYSWFNNLKEQVTENAVINLQNQIGNLTELATESKDSLAGAVNEVHADIETAKAEIAADVEETNERIDSIRVHFLEGEDVTACKDEQVLKKDVYRIIVAYPAADHFRYKKNGDILIISLKTNTVAVNEPRICELCTKDGAVINYHSPIYQIASSDNNAGYAYINMWKKKTLVLKVEEFAGTLYYTPINSQLYNSSAKFKTDMSTFRTLSMEGANALWNEVLHPIESGCFTDDTISLMLDIGKTYLLVTTEYTKSSGAVYGYRVRLATTPADGNVAKAAAGGNLIASTNAGVTISATANTAFTPEGFKKELTMKASSTYVVAYSLYEFGMFYGGTI